MSSSIAACGLSKGQVVRLLIASLAPGGDGVSRDLPVPVFVSCTAPGDLVDVEIFDVRKSFARGKLVEIVKPSPVRREAPCKLFKICGGCQWQHLTYQGQLQAKQEILKQTLEHLAGLSGDLVLAVEGADKELFYRNKVQFPVKNPRRSTRLLAGYYQRDSHQLVNIKHCPIQPAPLDRLLNAAKEVCEKHSFSAYEEKTRQGLLRHITFRYSFFEQKALLTLVVNAEPVALAYAKSVSSPAWFPDSGDLPDADQPVAVAGRHTGKSRLGRVALNRGPWPDRLKGAAEDLLALLPDLAGVCLNFHPQAGNRVYGDTTICLAGNSYVIERLSTNHPALPPRLHQGVLYRLSPLSFFQVNSEQAVKLLEHTLFAALVYQGPLPLIVDAYAGVGTIALWAAPCARRVIAIEENASAVADGMENSRLNQFENVEFKQGRVEQLLPRLMAEGTVPDVIILDPPRKGVTAEVLQTLAVMRPLRVVYVSCNPATLARDLQIIERSGYKTRQVQPIDLFPQTYHVESVARLDRIDTTS